MKEYIFPFTAIAGQENMKLSLILNAVDPRIGGVLVKGERGTAKSTAARALADLLPQQRVIADCRFRCSPDDPLHFCDECSTKYAGQNPPVRYARTPFVNLPISITEDRLVGTIDIEKALIDGEKHFEPGLFAEANRGILYVDEVNLLDDHIVDTLLDAAAMGINHVEREGISFAHPARFIIIGTMNPEEGDLRPQLLDRFAHSVEVHGISDASERTEIIRRTIEFETDPEKFCRSFEASQKELADRITAAQKRLNSVLYTQFDLYSIAEITTAFKLEGHRADIVILKTARALAAFEGRSQISKEDITRAAELAIPHRIVSAHTSGGNLSPKEIAKKTIDILSSVPASGFPNAEPGTFDDKKKAMI